MSGPKVVRIVTVEEVQAICRRLLAQVDGSAGELRHVARRLELLDTSLEESLLFRSQQLREMYAAGRWTELQKLAMDTLAFYPAERDRLRAVATAAAEAARSRRRRLADSARTVAEALRVIGKPVPKELAEVVAKSAMAQDDALAELERRVGAALSTIPASGMASDSSRLDATELAQRLATGEGTLTLAEWVAARVPTPTAAEQRLDRLVAELTALHPEEARVLLDRIASVAAEASAARRALLTDSLILDFSARLAEIRRREAVAARLREASASLLASPSQAAAALRTRIDHAARSGSAQPAEALVTEAAALLEAEEKAIAATSRRRAVLGALSTLGYEVRETMEQAWLRDGRIVLRKPGIQDYGVEIGAPMDLSRLQVRLVGSDKPSQPRTPRRDADHETNWCEEFSGLKELLAAAGGKIVVESAIAPGAQRVRTVSLPAVAEARTTSEMRTQTSRLP